MGATCYRSIDISAKVDNNAFLILIIFQIYTYPNIVDVNNLDIHVKLIHQKHLCIYIYTYIDELKNFEKKPEFLHENSNVV